MDAITEALLNEIIAFNNTNAWVHDGFIYIDSLKDPSNISYESIKAVRAMGHQLETVTERMIVVNDKNDPDHEIRVGNKSTKLIFGGKETSCHVSRLYYKLNNL